MRAASLEASSRVPLLARSQRSSWVPWQRQPVVLKPQEQPQA